MVVVILVSVASGLLIMIIGMLVLTRVCFLRLASMVIVFRVIVRVANWVLRARRFGSVVHSLFG